MKTASICRVLILLTILCTFTAAAPPPTGFTCISWCKGIYDLCKNNSQVVTVKDLENCINAKESCLKDCS